jgi:hypothetical protein
MAEFAREADFVAALEQLRGAGCKQVEAFAPYPVWRALPLQPVRRTPIPWIMLGAALLGGAGGFFMQWYAARIYPLNIGGRPLNSWPAFIPITFELTVLTSALAGLFAFFWLVRFPRLHHPAFADRRFARASQDRFFVCVRSADARFDAPALARLFAAAHAESIAEVPA